MCLNNAECFEKVLSCLETRQKKFLLFSFLAISLQEYFFVFFLKYFWLIHIYLTNFPMYSRKYVYLPFINYLSFKFYQNVASKT